MDGVVRVDDGVVEGSDISIFYDPMIAKLITYGPTREAAIDAQIGALDRFEIDGIGHNVDFLSALMQHPRFREGALTTGFIAEEYPDGFHGAPTDPALIRALAAVAAGMGFTAAAQARTISDQLGDPLTIAPEWTVRLDGRDHQVVLGEDHAMVDGGRVEGTMCWAPGQRLVEALADGRGFAVRVARTRTGWRLTTRGATHEAQVLPPHVAALTRHMIEKVPPDLSRFLLCPMPGLVTAINVAEGDTVEAGQPLAVIEAMKMENILRAEKAGTIKAVLAKAGDSMAVDAVILELA